MLLHAQVFKESISVADWQPSTAYQCEEDLGSACTRLIAKAIVSGSLKPKNSHMEPENTMPSPEALEQEEEQTECLQFRKNELTFHVCCLLSKQSNPTGKPLYLVAVTTIDPEKRAEWHQARTSSHDDEEDVDDLEAEQEEDAKLKFFDFQAALKADIKREGLQVKSLSKSIGMTIQSTAQRVWLEDDETSTKKQKQRSQGKLGAIEEHLDDIVTDVKANLTSLFSRGVKFDELTEKSENLKTHSSIMRRRARQIRIQSEQANSVVALSIFMCLMVLFLILSYTKSS